MARSSSSKVTTWCGSSFLAMPHLTTSCRPCRDSPLLFLLHLGDPLAALESKLGIAHLVLRPSDGCRDHQGACIDRNRDTRIAPKLPSLTPPILSAFSVQSWLSAVNPLRCHANSVCLGFILCREGVPSLGVVKLECVSMSLLSPCHHRLRRPSP